MTVVLYKRAKNGKVQQWSITLQGDSYYTQEGYVDGQLTQSKPTICEPKHVGRTNERTAEQQAASEVDSKIKKKKDHGYTESIDDIDQVTFLEPMLAYPYSKYKDKIKDNQVVASQPKLDGMRCRATKNGLFTRNGKRIVAAPHIEKEVKYLLRDCPDNLKFDGELYNHEYKDDFNTLMSVLRKSKIGDEDIERSRSIIEYHIYDIEGTDYDFQTRHDQLMEIIFGNSDAPVPYIVPVSTQYFPHGEQEFKDMLYAKYLEDGYEGQMIRIVNSMYENKRSKNLLKRKEFITEEFEVIDIEEGIGNRSGMMGRIVCKMNSGKVFSANSRGSHEYFKDLWENKEQYIGKMATIRYQNLTPEEQVPRFPVCITIRDYE